MKYCPLLLVLLLGATCRGAAEPAPVVPGRIPPQLEQVILVFKTHFDLGFTDLASNVVLRYRTSMIDQALEAVDASRGLPPAQQFAWTVSGWPLHAILDWPAQTPDRRHRVQQALKEGRLVVHALPVSLHTELLELEDLVRGLGYASLHSRNAGLPLPRDAKMSDVPCHTWILPTLLRHAGVEFLHLGCNSASSSPRVPPLFWWEGADGSRLLTFYSPAGYGSGLLPPADWPHKTWLALIQTGDNRGPPKPAEVAKLLAQAAAQMPRVKVRIGRLSDFADAIQAEQPQLPVVRGDMPDTWIHGPMCDPAGAALARTFRPALAATEALGTLLQQWGVAVPDQRAALAEAYEQSLLYGEHTWGGALRWVSRYGPGMHFAYGDEWKSERAQGRFAKLEASWAEHTAYIEKTRDRVRPALAHELKALAAAVGTSGQRLVVFNPLAWKRDGVVEVESDGAPIVALRPADGGEAVAVESGGGMLRFVARGVPAFGYRTYVPVERAAAPELLALNEASATMENAWLKIALDPTHGTICSLVDKRTGRELAGNTAQGLGQYLYERFDADQVARFLKAYGKRDVGWFYAEFGKTNLPPAREAPYRAISPRDFTLRFEQSPARITAIMEAPASADLPHAVTTRVTLWRDQRWAELAVTLHDKPADPWPEAGWICLPIRCETPQFRLGRQASVVDPAQDIVPGANRHLYAVTSGFSLADARGLGVGFCALDHPLVSLGEPGCWQYSLDYVPRAPVAYVNLFNNQWSTNFRLWNSGTWTSRVRLWPLEPGDGNAALVNPSLEARSPLLAGLADGAAGRLPATGRGVELALKGVQVTAFGPNPDGGGTVLRLWEMVGRSGPCRITIPRDFPARSAQSVDLRGTPVGPPIPINDGSFEVPLAAFAPASFVFAEKP